MIVTRPSTHRSPRRVRRRRGRPGDAEIRAALRSHLATVHAGEPDTAVLDEVGICRHIARADLVVVNGVLHAYEIKSDRDTLRRLARQSAAYGAVFDQVTLVVGAHHAESVGDLVPPWWGIVEVTAHRPAVVLTVRRGAAANPGRSARELVELLWRDAALDLLASRHSERGYRSRPRRDVWDRLCEVCTLDEIATAVRSHLTARAALGSAPTSA